MRVNQRVCHTCGATYDYCPGCARSTGKPQWMMLWDTEECMDVFHALSDYSLGFAEAADVKAALDKYGVTNYKKYRPEIQKQIQKILSSAKAEKTKDVDIDFKKERE